MDVEAVFDACDAYRYLEYDQSLPFWTHARTGRCMTFFSYLLYAQGDDVAAWIPEAVVFDMSMGGTEPTVERISIDRRITCEVPSSLGGLEIDAYAYALSNLPSDVPWNQMVELIEQTEPPELLPLYEAVHRALA